MPNASKSPLRRRIAVFAALASTAAGCANILDIPERRTVVENASTDPPTCSGAIQIRLLADSYSPAKEVAYPYVLGEIDLLREVNETGGIYGCKLEWDIRDYGYDPLRAQQIYEGWKAAPDWGSVVAILGLASGDTLRLGPLAKVDRKVFISGTLFGALAAPNPIEIPVDVPEVSDTFQELAFPTSFKADGYPYNFFVGTDYSTAMRVAMFHAKARGGNRVGFIHCSAGQNPFCTGPLAAGRTYAKRIGLELGRSAIVELTDDEPTTLDKLTAFFDQEYQRAATVPTYKPVDWMWVGNLPVSAANIAKAVAAIKERRGIRDLELIVNSAGFDEGLFSRCGAACVDSVHGVMPFTAFGDKSRQSSEMVRAVALHDKWRARDGNAPIVPSAAPATPPPPPPTRNVRYIQGYTAALVLKIALERVIATRQPLTSESVKAALEGFSSVDTGGLTDRLTFTPNDHRPQSTLAIYKIGSGGQLEYEPPDRTIALEPAWLGW